MLISTRHRFLFVHVPKTAGTSIAEALAPHAEARPFTPRAAIRRALPLRQDVATAWFQMHDPASLIRARLGAEAFDGLLSFAVVRDPFGHAVSHYRFLKRYPYRAYREKARRLGFEEFLRWRAGARLHPFRTRVSLFARMSDQARYVVDARDRVLVDRVLRMDRLGTEFPALCRELGLPELPLGRERASDAGDAGPSPELTPEAVRLIRQIYARDFDLFGFAPTPEGLG